MDQFQIYVLLLVLVVVIGQIFYKSLLPTSLLLVIAGMLLSFLPGLPDIKLDPELILNIFLPLLLYQISSFSSLNDMKKSYRPITLLSIGHVIFITVMVAVIIHTLIPSLGWPLAFVLGAVVSPPDDVAIISIAEKIRVPRRILTILEGEGLFNDAAALILFRFAVIAAVSHEFLVVNALMEFFAIVIGETLYGLLLGNVLGYLRLKLSNSKLHIIASILTPFLAYFPAEMLGGSGVLATVVTGFVIGSRYSMRFQPEFRLVSFAVWPALGFTIQSILFLLVGLDMESILNNISSIPVHDLILYGSATIATVIIGRFIWVYLSVYFLPRFLFKSTRKKDPYPPWQFPFLVSWSGMRGSISLAAALAIPLLPHTIEGASPRDLIIFLVFCVIAATFVLQGLTLPWLLKVLGVEKYTKQEESEELLSELATRLSMTNAVLRWLLQYRRHIGYDEKLLNEIKVYVNEYRILKNKLRSRIKNHRNHIMHNEKIEIQAEVFLLTQIIEIERAELSRLWHEQKINLELRNKLLARLDHRSRHIAIT